MITSRDTRRWVIPKGNRIAGLSLHEAAEREAFEEAGITGTASVKALGTYRYDKQRKNGSNQAVAVRVFPFAFKAQLDEWPEQHERKTEWFTLTGAADAVEESELKKIILAFRGGNAGLGESRPR